MQTVAIAPNYSCICSGLSVGALLAISEVGSRAPSLRAAASFPRTQDSAGTLCSDQLPLLLAPFASSPRLGFSFKVSNLEWRS